MWGGGVEILEHQPCKSIDYIHFLDSDDWLELNCIEECVRIGRESGAEIIWHSFKICNEMTGEVSKSSYFDENSLKDQEILSGFEVFERLKSPSFSWVWSGMVKLKSCKNLRFLEGIESEDALFGMQLFALVQSIVITHKDLMHYRMRPNSISQHTLENKRHKNKQITFPEHQGDLVEAFGNAFDIKRYSFAYSYAVICCEMLKFMRQRNFSKIEQDLIIGLIEHGAIFAFSGCGFLKDPRNVREICSHLTPYMRKVRLGSKLAYFYPKIYRPLKRIKIALESLQ